MRKSKRYGAFVLNRRVVLHAIDATPARWRGGAGSSPLDGASAAASSPRNDLVKNSRLHPTHLLISMQVATGRKEDEEEVEAAEGLARRTEGASPPLDLVRLRENVQSVWGLRVPRRAAQPARTACSTT